MQKKSLSEIQEQIKKLKEEQSKLEEESLKILKEEGGEGIYTIRPAGRHVLTIGEDLIQDQCAALVELVKNAYDADSESVEISFSRITDESILIKILDQGYGMSAEDIVNKWLVPSTTNKLNSRISPAGRTMQGCKGIGRYSASILGNEFEIRSITSDGICNSVKLNWKTFRESEYLDQVNVKVHSERTTENKGTLISVIASGNQADYWNEKNIQKLRYALKRLVSPKDIKGKEEIFEIRLSFEDFFEDEELNVEEVIEAFPIMDFYDYRISGTVFKEGNAVLEYETQKLDNTTKEKIAFECGETGCGDLIFDIRVYDRENDSIDRLIRRGLKDNRTGNYISRIEAKELINSVNGVGVYRNGFRIRPLGDPDFDWLKLNQKRIQNPSRKIGSDQVTGYVHIQSEALSQLEEKSARDGLKENEAYERLKEITNQVIVLLETRRFELRRKLGLSAPKKKIERQLAGLYDYSKLKKSVRESLESAGMSQSAIGTVEKLICEEEVRNNETVEEIRKTIAIYQGQATIGKIINIVLHEGRRPLNYFKGQIKNLQYYNKKFVESNDVSTAKKIIGLSEGFAENAQIFVRLFGKIDPLAAKRRENKKLFGMKEVLEGVVAVFESQLLKEEIEVKISCSEEIKFDGWKQDFYTIFTNLIDNSIYWIVEKQSPNRLIRISVSNSEDEFIVDYCDSGPGISVDLLESEIIFEPDFSTKIDGGSGLGLAIAGEAAERNNLELLAVQSDEGAHFILRTKEV